MNGDNVLTEHYEELRCRALGRQSDGLIWGLVVLRTKGMASWAKSWQESSGAGPQHGLPKRPVAGLSCISSLSNEVVQVLAGMVWALRKEADV